METLRTLVGTINTRELGVLAVLMLLVGGIALAESVREPMTSVEMRFVEHSTGGLQIVPASCPSEPHYAGECSGLCPDGSPIPNSGECDIPDNPIDVCPNIPGIQLNGPCTNDDIPPPPPLPPIETGCPVGYVLSTWGTYQGLCVFHGCPAGYRLEGVQCVQNIVGQCTQTYFCIGSNLYQRNAQCTETLVQACALGCSGGGCLSSPPGDGNITVNPTLVRSGDKTTVSWTTSGMEEDTCFVVENNPDINDIGSGEDNSFLSSAITQQTTYTLTCEREEEGGTFTDSATVNVIPIFQEN